MPWLFFVVVNKYFVKCSGTEAFEQTAASLYNVNKCSTVFFSDNFLCYILKKTFFKNYGISGKTSRCSHNGWLHKEL